MKVKDVLNYVTETRHDQYGEDIKMDWLNKVEAQVYLDILSRARGYQGELPYYKWDEDADTELLVPHPYDELYVHYIEAMIDYTNGEFARYNNSLAVFEDSWNDFAAYYRRTHFPKQPWG